jgi:hypothetical protein
MADNSRKLRRAEAARFLTEAGYQTSKATLDKLATVGGGPRFQKFSRFPVYTEQDLLDWAHSRCSPLVRSTSELPPTPPPDEQWPDA